MPRLPAAALLTLLCLLCLQPGCVHVRIAPVEVKAKVELDITLKADRVIEEYLGELNRKRQELIGNTP